MDDPAYITLHCSYLPAIFIVLSVSTVVNEVKRCHHCGVDEPAFLAAAALLFAVEANLVEAEIPDWPEKTLVQVARLMADVSKKDPSSLGETPLTEDL